MDYDTSKWIGDIDKFTVLDHALRSNSTVVNDQFEILHPADSVQEWHVELTLAHKTSSSNYTDLLLLSSPNSNAQLYLRFGGVKDKINVMETSPDHDTILYESPESITENSRWKLNIRRTDDHYILNCYSVQDDTNYLAEFHSELHGSDSLYCGWRIKQSTSSFFGKHALTSLYAGPFIPDTVPPKLVSISYYRDSIKLLFNEILNDISSTVNHPLEWKYTLQDKQLTLYSPAGFDNGNYKIDLLVRDTANNLLDSTIHLKIFNAETAEPLDVVINEILFDPYPDGHDFVELYNRSNKDLDLSSFNLCRSLNGSRSNKIQITDTIYPFLPGQYVAISEDIQELCYTYNCPSNGGVLQTKTPPMNNDEGILLLLYADEIIDSFHYTDEMHLSLLPDTEGVSLERVSPSAPTDQASNWRSASTLAGYATPADKNSHYAEYSSVQSICLAFSVISPNNDGFQDDLTIGYSFKDDDYIANLYIFSLAGNQIHQAVNTDHVPAQGQLRWDMTLSSGALLPQGHYIAYVELIGLSGFVCKKKLAFSVASQ